MGWLLFFKMLYFSFHPQDVLHSSPWRPGPLPWGAPQSLWAASWPCINRLSSFVRTVQAKSPHIFMWLNRGNTDVIFESFRIIAAHHGSQAHIMITSLSSWSFLDRVIPDILVALLLKALIWSCTARSQLLLRAAFLLLKSFLHLWRLHSLELFLVDPWASYYV